MEKETVPGNGEPIPVSFQSKGKTVALGLPEALVLHGLVDRRDVLYVSCICINRINVNRYFHVLNTGLRKEEILSLEWEKHIDLRHGFLLFDMTKNGERREIPINQTLRGVLSRIPRRLDSPFVFVNEGGKRYGDVKMSFYSACRRVGIKDFRFHDLRHIFASHLTIEQKRTQPVWLSPRFSMVAPPRIELGTRGFSVLCSTI